MHEPQKKKKKRIPRCQHIACRASKKQSTGTGGLVRKLCPTKGRDATGCVAGARRCGSVTVRYDTASYALVRYGAVMFSMIYRSVRYGCVWHATVWYGTVMYAILRYGNVSSATVRYGTIMYGKLRCGNVWYATVRTIRYVQRQRWCSNQPPQVLRAPTFGRPCSSPSPDAEADLDGFDFAPV